MKDEQLEAWPDFAVKERVTRAVNVATKRADAMAKQSWPRMTRGQRHTLELIVVTAIAAYVTDVRAPE